MKPLDDYIRANLERFNTEEPMDGHFDRFDSKLKAWDKTRNRQLNAVFLRIAAVLILGLVISYAAIREFKYLNQNAGKIVSAVMYPELNEAENFYNAQLEQYYVKIQDLKFNNDQVEKKQILKELSEMDQQVQSMKKDLKQNPDDERVVHAIINFYQVKIELMDMIIARTQQTTNTIL